MNDTSSNNSVTFAKAQEHFNTNKLQRAAELCQSILDNTLGDFDAQAQHLLGQVSAKTGYHFMAVQWFQKSIGIQPLNANAHLDNGRSLYQICRLDEAIISFRKAIKLNNKLSEARTLLLSSRNEIKQIDEMIKSVDKSGEGASIKFTQNEIDNQSPDIETLNRGYRLYLYFGYLIVEDLFPEQLIDDLHKDFKKEYSKYDAHKSFDDAQTVGNKRVMLTVKLQDAFNNPKYYANPLLMPLLARILGKDLILLSQGSVRSLPGAKLQPHHRDHPSLFEGEVVDDKLPSFAVTVGIPLIEMNETIGTTRVYAKTHKSENELSEADRKKGFSPRIKKGSCLFFDYRILHEGTPNNSDKIRPLMYNIYSRPWFRDYKNYSNQSPMQISDEEFSKIPKKFRYLFNWTRQEY